MSPVIPVPLVAPQGLNMRRSFQTLSQAMTKVGSFSFQVQFPGGAYFMIVEASVSFLANATAGKRVGRAFVTLPNSTSSLVWDSTTETTANFSCVYYWCNYVTADSPPSSTSRTPIPIMFIPPASLFTLTMVGTVAAGDTFSGGIVSYNTFLWDGSNEEFVPEQAEIPAPL